MNRDGFLLIELLVALALFGYLSCAMMSCINAVLLQQQFCIKMITITNVVHNYIEYMRVDGCYDNENKVYVHKKDTETVATLSPDGMQKIKLSLATLKVQALYEKKISMSAVYASVYKSGIYAN